MFKSLLLMYLKVMGTEIDVPHLGVMFKVCHFMHAA